MEQLRKEIEDKIRKEKEEEERKRKEEEDRINKGKLTLDELSTNNLKTNDETINNQKLRGRYNKNLGNDIYSDEDEKLYNELKEKRRRLNLMKDKYTQYLDLSGIDIDNLDSDELEILENLYQAQLKDVDKTKKLIDKIRRKRKGDLLKNSTNYFKSSLKDTEDQIKEKIMKFKRERNERHKINRKLLNKQFDEIDNERQNKNYYDYYTEKNLPTHHNTNKFFGSDSNRIRNIKRIDFELSDLKGSKRNKFNFNDDKFELSTMDSNSNNYRNIIMPSNPFSSVLKAHEDNFFN